MIDYTFIELGINDVFGGILAQSDIDGVINNAKTLINAVLDTTYGYPGCKVILAIPSIGGNSKDGYALNYGSTVESEQYERNMRLLWESMIQTFENGAYKRNVRLSINGLMIDRYYGYGRSLVNVSQRDTTQIQEHTNGVHPISSGYFQLADAFYSALRSLQ